MPTVGHDTTDGDITREREGEKEVEKEGGEEREWEKMGKIKKKVRLKVGKRRWEGGHVSSCLLTHPTKDVAGRYV